MVTFDIGTNELRAGGAKALAKALKDHHVLQKLNIANNQLILKDDAKKVSDIDPSGIIAISEAISTMRALAILDISHNYVSDHVACKQLWAASVQRVVSRIVISITSTDPYMTPFHVIDGFFETSPLRDLHSYQIAIGLRSRVLIARRSTRGKKRKRSPQEGGGGEPMAVDEIPAAGPWRWQLPLPQEVFCRALLWL